MTRFDASEPAPGPFDADALRIDQISASARAEVLSAYLDDELSTGAARVVTAWLDDHPEALRGVEHDRRVWDLLAHGYGDEAVPEGFAPAVLSRVRRPRVRLLTWRSLPIAAAALVVIGLGVGFLLGRGPSPAPQAPPVAAQPTLQEVPAEYLEDVDTLLALSDEEFDALLLSDLAHPEEEASGS